MDNKPVINPVSNKPYLIQPEDLQLSAAIDRAQCIPDAVSAATEHQPGEGLKFDGGKTNWSLIPLGCTEGVAKILTFGAKKYAANSWQNVEEERYYSAMMRHYSAMMGGEEFDEESGLPHAYHFLCNAYFITWKHTEGKNK